MKKFTRGRGEIILILKNPPRYWKAYPKLKSSILILKVLLDFGIQKYHVIDKNHYRYLKSRNQEKIILTLKLKNLTSDHLTPLFLLKIKSFDSLYHFFKKSLKSLNRRQISQSASVIADSLSQLPKLGTLPYLQSPAKGLNLQKVVAYFSFHIFAFFKLSIKTPPPYKIPPQPRTWLALS